MKYIKHKNTKQIGSISISQRTYRILKLNTKCIQYSTVEIIWIFLHYLSENKRFLELAHQRYLKALDQSKTNFSTRSLLLVA